MKFVPLIQPCREIVPLISQALDCELGLIGRIKVKLHLMACELCRRYLDHLKTIRAAVNLGEADILSSNQLSETGRRRLRNTLRKHDTN